MRRFVTWSLIVSALAAAIGLFVWNPTGGSAADAPYRLATVDRGAITASVRATGTLNPVTTILVGSQLSGQVVEILADYNSPVKAGEVVARLYSEQIKARRDAARADVEQTRADLGMRRAQLDRTRASRLKAEATLRDQVAQRDRVNALLSEARRAIERQTELSGKGVGSQTALDASRTQGEVQKAALASAEAQISLIQAEMTGLDADIVHAQAQAQSAAAAILQREAKLKDIEIDLDRADIRSPVDGVVVKRDIELGQTVAASFSSPTLFTIAQDLREIDIYANVDEADVGRLKAGQTVSFTVNAYPNRTFDGAVRMVRLGGQTVQNVVTYTAVIRVANLDMALLPGMTANLQIVTEERGDALRIPNAALRFKPVGAAPVTTAAPPAGAALASPEAAEGGRAGPEGRRAGGGGGRALQAQRERLIAEVQPTPEQLGAIDTVFAEARENSPGREPGLGDDERRSAMRAFRSEIQRKVAAILDPERRAKYEAILAEARPGRATRAEAGAPARIFTPGQDGKPVAVAVRVGATDGSFTEVLAGDIKEGAAVIVGGGPRPPPATTESSPAQRPRGPRLF